MADPALFKRLSLLYFAAASYSETGPPPRPRASGTRIPAQRAPALWRGVARVRGARRHGAKGSARAALFDRIDRGIEPFDTAGLLDRSRRDWYPVLAADLVASAAKLASAEEVDRLLARCRTRPERGA